MGSSKKEDQLEMKGKDERGWNSIAIIFRYADWVDVVLMVMGALGAIGDGMSTNVLLIFVSRIMNSLGYGNNKKHGGNFMSEVEKVSICIYML